MFEEQTLSAAFQVVKIGILSFLIFLCNCFEVNLSIPAPRRIEGLLASLIKFLVLCIILLLIFTFLNNLIDLSTNPDSISNAFKEKEDLPIFIHYAGSNKPWFFNGILSDDSQFYQQVYKSLFSYNYHLVTPWKKFLLLQLIDYIKNMKSYKVQHRSSLVYLAIKRLIVK